MRHHEGEPGDLRWPCFTFKEISVSRFQYQAEPGIVLQKCLSFSLSAPVYQRLTAAKLTRIDQVLCYLPTKVSVPTPRDDNPYLGTSGI